MFKAAVRGRGRIYSLQLARQYSAEDPQYPDEEQQGASRPHLFVAEHTAWAGVAVMVRQRKHAKAMAKKDEVESRARMLRVCVSVSVCEDGGERARGTMS